MFQQSAANLNFFPYRLHNETLDKKINSTHDCQDYYNSFGVEISRNFTTSALLRIYSKRMAVTNQPLCQPSPQAFSARSILGCFSMAAIACEQAPCLGKNSEEREGKGGKSFSLSPPRSTKGLSTGYFSKRPKVWPPLINTHSFIKALTNQRSRTVSSWLLIGLNLHERTWIN